MRKKYFFFILLSIITSNGVKAADVFEDWVNQLEKDYDDITLVTPIRNLEISFVFNRDKAQPEAIIKYKIEITSLKSNNIVESFPVFINDMSIAYDFKLNGKDLDNDEISNFDYHGENIFYSDSKAKVISLNFSKVGDKNTIEYKRKITDLKYIGQFYFNHKYPIQHVSIQIKIPDWLTLDIERLNFEGANINIEKLGTNAFRFSKSYLDPWHKEKNAPGPTYLYPHLLLLPKAYNHSNKENTIFKTLDDLYGWYRSLVKDIGNNSEKLNELVKGLIDGKTSEKEKLKVIYYWVQDNIRYIAFEDGIAGFKPEACQDVLEKKYGDCKGMANLTAEMLKIAGFDARLTWLGTRRIAYDYTYPSLNVDNHMICAVILGEKIYFLDPTEKYTALGENATRIRGQEALIEDGEKYLRKKIKGTKDNKLSYHIKLKLESESLIANVQYIRTGESKTEFLRLFNIIEKDEFEREFERILEDRNPNNSVKNINYHSSEDRDKPIDISYSLKIDNAVSLFGNEVYLNIDPYKDYEEWTIDNKRKFDLLQDFQKEEFSHIEFEIPSDMKVTYLPEPLSITNDEFEISINYNLDGNKINYYKVFNFKKDHISRKNFDVWNTAIKDLKLHYEEMIVLEKK